MKTRARVVVFLTYHENTKGLDVFLGDENPEFGAVKRSVLKDDATIGLYADGTPAFIRITDVENANRTFKTIARNARRRRALTPLQWDHVVAYCLKRTDEILEHDGHRRKPEMVRYAFNSVASEAE